MTFLLLIAVPLLGGALAGRALRQHRGTRFSGATAFTLLAVLPALACAAAALAFPVVGTFDAGLEGLLAGLALAWAGHRAFETQVAMTAALIAIVLSLGVLELGCRLLLPRPPAFPPATPRLLLTDSERTQLRGDGGGDLDTVDTVCSIVYGDRYPLHGVRSDIVTPERYAPTPGSSLHILHVGDSVTFGDGVARSETFESELERREPGVEHTNSGISGAAPDQYLAVLSRWLDRARFDGAVMYLYEGNDLELDLRHPCSGWETLLAYSGGTAQLRYPGAPRLISGGRRRDGLIESPPPYLLRVLVSHSAAAAYLAAAMVEMRTGKYRMEESDDLRMQHVAAVLHAARDLAVAHHVPFAVVVLPAMSWLTLKKKPRPIAEEMLAAARKLGIPTLDPSEFLRAELGRGEQLMQPDDVHFTAHGNAVLAQWLHEKLLPALHLERRDASAAK